MSGAWLEHCRKLGKSRIEISRKAETKSDWDKLWFDPENKFPFDFGDFWKMTVEYKVNHFAAEVGFYTDILGFPINALSPTYAMFTSPGGDFHISVTPAPRSVACTPYDAMKIEFMVKDIIGIADDLVKRGILLEDKPEVHKGKGTKYLTSSFRTPNGIKISLWGII